MGKFVIVEGKEKDQIKFESTFHGLWATETSEYVSLPVIKTKEVMVVETKDISSHQNQGRAKTKQPDEPLRRVPKRG